MASTQIPLNPANQNATKSLRAAYAQHVLRQHLLAKLNAASPVHHDFLPKTPPLPRRGKDAGAYEGRICIIGAGVTGLYLGMMLKYLGIKNVHIIEGNDRMGGRLYTYPLPVGGGAHSYYDIGAMRIPDLPWMKPTLNLIDNIGVSKKKYYYVNGAGMTNPVSYFYDHEPIKDPRFDAFMEPIVAPFTDNYNVAFENWMLTNNDNYSMRGILMTGQHSEDTNAPLRNWTYNQTARAELYDTSTGLFDQAFTEMVIDYADFQAASTINWYRVEGGGQEISKAMYGLLISPNWPSEGSSTIQPVDLRRPVVALSVIPNGNIGVTYNDSTLGRVTAEYDMVFNTTAMAPLQKMDLEGLNLDKEILTGIRSLGYDRATKVAIKFKKPWWFQNQNQELVYGGISGSDLPIRSVVYPSWNDGPEEPAVLMVSYTWAQDATRMASIVPVYTAENPPKKTDPIVRLCLENLVKLWSGQENPPSYALLDELYLEHHAFAWENDPWTGGAYALYGPAQYKDVYPKFTELLCNDKLAICGEAISAHHAWISGSLDSAYIKLTEFLIVNGLVEEEQKLKDSWFGAGHGEDPEEMDEELIRWALLLGEGGGPKGWGDGLNLKKPHKGSSKTLKATKVSA